MGVSCEKFKELEEFILKLKDKNGALIEVLHYAQNLYGYIGEETQEFLLLLVMVKSLILKQSHMEILQNFIQVLKV